MKIASTFVLLFSLLTAGAALAGDSAAGKKIYKKKNCKQCHKKDGMGKAKMVGGKYKLSAAKGPRIAGLSEEYVYAQLVAIQGKDKATARKTKYTSSMKAKIKKLTNEDFKNLAAYISKDLNPAKGKIKGLLEK
jgi:cytochrome c553